MREGINNRPPSLESPGMLIQTFKFSGGRGQESAFLTTLPVILIHSYSLIDS